MSIQCRAQIDTAIVDEYAERMTAGDSFPPVVLFGTSAKAWIGDGWHRVAASEQIGALDIDAEIRPGGRIEALQHALGVNRTHGLKRTNADKRRCVEIADREFTNLSSRQIAQLCGVSVDFVARFRQVSSDDTSPTVTGADGKQYPARREKAEPAEARQPISVGVIEASAPQSPAHREPFVPCFGLQFARIAIMQLAQIRRDDSERQAAFDTVRRWIDEQ